MFAERVCAFYCCCCQWLFSFLQDLICIIILSERWHVTYSEIELIIIKHLEIGVHVFLSRHWDTFYEWKTIVSYYLIRFVVIFFSTHLIICHNNNNAKRFRLQFKWECLFVCVFIVKPLIAFVRWRNLVKSNQFSFMGMHYSGFNDSRSVSHSTLTLCDGTYKKIDSIQTQCNYRWGRRRKRRCQLKMNTLKKLLACWWCSFHSHDIEDLKKGAKQCWGSDAPTNSRIYMWRLSCVS